MIFSIYIYIYFKYNSSNTQNSQYPKQFYNYSKQQISYKKHNHHLPFIPPIPNNTLILKFTKNFLPLINQKTFQNITSTQLKKLILNKNKIQNITNNTFKIFPQLTFLNLNKNQFPISILKKNFYKLHHNKLKKLYLIQITLPNLPINIFKYLQNISTLQKISLNYNNISNLIKNIFSKIQKLQNLNLNNNSITNINFKNTHLKIIQLH